MYLLEKNFDNGTTEDLELLKKYFEAYDYKASGHTFSSMYMWGPEYYSSWEVIDGFLWTASSYVDEEGQQNFYSTMPLSLNGYNDLEALRNSIKKMKEIFESKGKRLILYQVPKDMVSILQRAWEGRLKIEDDPDSFDYVYDKEKLINLSGRALHKKKNHLNYFLKNYKYTVEDLKEEDHAEAISFIEDFNQHKDTETEFEASALANETKAIKRALDYTAVFKPEYLTKVIKIDGHIQALAIGALVGTKEAVTHIEKANPMIRGLYQAINWEFAKCLPKKVQLVNREEDMGIAKLRQAKEGYQPVRMYEKSTVVVL